MSSGKSADMSADGVEDMGIYFKGASGARRDGGENIGYVKGPKTVPGEKPVAEQVPATPAPAPAMPTPAEKPVAEQVPAMPLPAEPAPLPRADAAVTGAHEAEELRLVKELEAREAEARLLAKGLKAREREILELRALLAKSEAEAAEYHGRLERVSVYVRGLREQDRATATDERGLLEGSRRALADDYRACRDRMERDANEWQRSICGAINGLEEGVRALADMRQGLLQSVRSWREEMFAGKFGEMGYVYRQLCVILDVAEQSDAARAAMGEPTFPELGKLRRWQARFESALAGIGLEVIRPCAGERFDRELHELDEGSAQGGLDPDEALVVTGCVHPGLGYRSDDMFVVEVPAVVAAARL